MHSDARRAAPRGLLAEWPTWAALAGCYLAWVTLMASHGAIGFWVLPALAVVTAFQSSLQHEALHGHPTRNAALNEALVWLPLGLVFAYRRFRDLHLKHHNDNRLTDPYDDPESYYVAEGDFAKLGPVMRRLLAFNGTFAGRMLVGPALSLHGFWRSELAKALAGDRVIRNAWAHHFAGLALLVPLILWLEVPLWQYFLFVSYPAVALIMIRSFIEHRAHDAPKMRTAIVESGPFFSLLFLNNNLHRVHHESPAAPWYRLPAMYRAERARYLAENGGYLIHGYSEVVRRWLVKAREPVVHPLFRRLTAPRKG